MEFQLKLNEYKFIAEEYFKKRISEADFSGSLSEAVRYSFFGGGKRIRPVLMLAVSDYLGVDFSLVLPFAFSLECIHEHSLIHDDLPALDNDDVRRGKLSCHKKFSEHLAILSGDYLLNYAYEACLTICDTPEKIKALSVLASSTGLMLSGQVLDTTSQYETAEASLISVYEKKTASLLTACFTIPLILANKGELISDFSNLGRSIGLLFQITDDIIDYSKRLEAKDELNFVKIFGVKHALDIKNELYFECNKILDKHKDFTFLKSFVDYISERCE